MITPDALVRHVHAELAFAGGFHNGTVHVDRRTVEEFLRLLTPHLPPSFVDGRMQRVNVRLAFEPTTEVARRRCVRNTLRSECIQIRFVASLLLEIFQTRSVRHRVESDVENMIGLVIRKVILQQFDVAIDGIDQSALPSHRMCEPDSSITRC